LQTELQCPARASVCQNSKLKFPKKTGAELCTGELKPETLGLAFGILGADDNKRVIADDSRHMRSNLVAESTTLHATHDAKSNAQPHKPNISSTCGSCTMALA
jgi:hypothetical protein